MSPEPLPYKWDMQGNAMTISVSHGPLDATFTGELSDDGRSFSGGWRPPGGTTTTSPGFAATAYDLLATFSVVLGIPLSLTALVTGITLGLGTKWGVLPQQLSRD